MHLDSAGCLQTVIYPRVKRYCGVYICTDTTMGKMRICGAADVKVRISNSCAAFRLRALSNKIIRLIWLLWSPAAEMLPYRYPSLSRMATSKTGNRGFIAFKKMARLKEIGINWNQWYLIFQYDVPRFFKTLSFTSVFTFVPFWYALICTVKFQISELKLVSKMMEVGSREWQSALPSIMNYKNMMCILTKTNTCGAVVEINVFFRS